MISWALMPPLELAIALVCVWVLVAAYVLTRPDRKAQRENDFEQSETSE